MQLKFNPLRPLATLTLSAFCVFGASAQANKNSIQIHYIGHAAFEITSDKGTKVIIDPFIKNNPDAPADTKDLSAYKADVILVSHSHFDHSADVAELAKVTHAPVVSAYEWLEKQDIPAAQKMGVNVGGAIKIKELTIHIVPAMHSSDPGGRPVGFVITFADGRNLYHTGDTWIFSDMALIAEMYHPAIILSEVGGGPYGQDVDVAKMELQKYFTNALMIPMHYGTFPVLTSVKQVTDAFAGNKQVYVMKFGETKGF